MTAAKSTRQAEGLSTPQLITQMLENVSSLVRDEIALAKAEIRESVRSAVIGTGLFGGAGVLALYGGGALVAAAIAGLAVVLPTWASALIIGVALFAIAGVLILVGKRRVEAAKPPVETVTANVQRDIETMKAAGS